MIQTQNGFLLAADLEDIDNKIQHKTREALKAHSPDHRNLLIREIARESHRLAIIAGRLKA